jgi:hypothetical protein
MTERKAMVANQASYDIMVIPREVKIQILEFCNVGTTVCSRCMTSFLNKNEFARKMKDKPFSKDCAGEMCLKNHIIAW